MLQNVAIAFPDEGAIKRFGGQFHEFDTILCSKVRGEGNKRIVTVKEGAAAGRHVFIIDDLVQTGTAATLQHLLRQSMYIDFNRLCFYVACVSPVQGGTLIECKNALIKQYQKLFDLEDVQLTFTDEALEAIAKKAIERKTGARGLRSIVEGLLLDTMFDLPTLEGVTEVVVDRDVVDGRKEPVQVHKGKEEAA